MVDEITDVEALKFFNSFAKKWGFDRAEILYGIKYGWIAFKKYGWHEFELILDNTTRLYFDKLSEKPWKESYVKLINALKAKQQIMLCGSKTVWERYYQRVIAGAGDTFEEMMIHADLNNGEEI